MCEEEKKTRKAKMMVLSERPSAIRVLNNYVTRAEVESAKPAIEEFLKSILGKGEWVWANSREELLETIDKIKDEKWPWFEKQKKKIYSVNLHETEYPDYFAVKLLDMHTDGYGTTYVVYGNVLSLRQFIFAFSKTATEIIKKGVGGTNENSDNTGKGRQQTDTAQEYNRLLRKTDDRLDN